MSLQWTVWVCEWFGCVDTHYFVCQSLQKKTNNKERGKKKVAEWKIFPFFHSFFLPPSLIVLTKCNIHTEGWRHTAPDSLPPEHKKTLLDDTWRHSVTSKMLGIKSSSLSPVWHCSVLLQRQIGGPLGRGIQISTPLQPSPLPLPNANTITIKMR